MLPNQLLPKELLPSKKEFEMFNIAKREAKNSNMQSQHGCVITCGGKPISTGYNNRRSMIQGKFTFGAHAEGHASSLLPIRYRPWVL